MMMMVGEGGGDQSSDLTLTVAASATPVVAAIVGSSVAPYFAASARPVCRLTGLPGVPAGPAQNLIAFNVLSMALMALIPTIYICSGEKGIRPGLTRYW